MPTTNFPVKRRISTTAALKGARLVNDQLHTVLDDLTQRLLVTTMVASVRHTDMTTATAAKVCHMTEDNFKRCFTIVDAEARRMLLASSQDD